MSFPKENDLTEFKIVFVDEDEGTEGLKFKLYTWEYFLDALKKFKKLNFKLAISWMKLKTEYDISQGEHPLLHPNAPSQ